MNVYTLIITLMALSMFFLKRKHKILVLWFSLMCCTLFREIPIFGVLLNVPTCFFISEYKNICSQLNRHNFLWLKKILLIVVLGIVILYFTSPHYFRESTINGAISITIFQLVRKYFFVLYAFAIVEWDSLRPFYKVSVFGILLLTIWGIAEMITGTHIFAEKAFSGIENVDIRTEELLSGERDTERFRALSMFKFCFDYGYMSLCALLLGIYGYGNKNISKMYSVILLVCGMAGIFMSNCRTLYVCFIAAVITCVFSMYKFKRAIGTLSVLLLAVIVVFFTFPMKGLYNLFMSTFDTSEETEVSGSSISQRELSYAAAFKYASNNIVFGNGLDYFANDLGYANRETVDSDLAGLEGVLMSLLLERGIIGLFCWALFYGVLFYQIYKLRWVDKRMFACCLSILVSYLLYANFTGELKSVPPTLFLVGLFLKLLSIKKNEIQTSFIQSPDTSSAKLPNHITKSIRN